MFNNLTINFFLHFTHTLVLTVVSLYFNNFKSFYRNLVVWMRSVFCWSVAGSCTCEPAFSLKATPPTWPFWDHPGWLSLNRSSCLIIIEQVILLIFAEYYQIFGNCQKNSDLQVANKKRELSQSTPQVGKVSPHLCDDNICKIFPDIVFRAWFYFCGPNISINWFLVQNLLLPEKLGSTVGRWIAPHLRPLSYSSIHPFHIVLGASAPAALLDKNVSRNRVER